MKFGAPAPAAQSSSSSSSAAGLPMPPALRELLRRLPTQPPSWLLSKALNRLLLPKLSAEAVALLSHRVVEIEVQDLGLRCRLGLSKAGFAPTWSAAAPALRIVAPSSSYWRLLRGEDDADRLFFERALLMEGDTEYGLILKNTLDALGPLLPQRKR